MTDSSSMSSEGLDKVRVARAAPCYPFRIMRARILIARCLVGALGGFAQDAPAPQPGQIKDPRAIFAAAAPFYDYSDTALKPFHLKATYQLYDENGKPSEQGTFEYWWASPNVHRASWTRPGATRTYWHTADGKEAYVETGERLGYFEKGLQSNLFSPLPSKEAIDPSKFHLIRNDLKLGGTRFQCVSEAPLKGDEPLDFRMSPTKCFDPALPVLRFQFDSQGFVTTNYENFAKFQGKYLARTIQILGGDQKLFSAVVDSTNPLDPTDPALVPTKDAIFEPDSLHATGSLEVGTLTKQLPPVYPPMAKSQRLQGSVLIDTTIDVDGKIKEPCVLFSPSPILSAASLDAISQWRYKPYLQNGIPTEVETLIVVVFTLGR
jgi:TonB family protein